MPKNQPKTRWKSTLLWNSPKLLGYRSDGAPKWLESRGSFNNGTRFHNTFSIIHKILQNGPTKNDSKYKKKKQKQKKIGHLLRSFEWGASAEFNKKSCSEAAPKLLRICTGNENDHLNPPKNYRSKTKRKKKKNSDTSKPNLKTSGTSSAPF